MSIDSPYEYQTTGGSRWVIPDSAISGSDKQKPTGQTSTGVGVVGLGENPKDRIGITKPPLHLVPPASKLHQAEAMRNGADKYGPYNWRENKVKATVYISAAQRHLDQWLDGEENAEDSGVHHLGHALACIGILLDAQETGNLVDDRPLPGAATKVIKKLTKNPETKIAPIPFTLIPGEPMRFGNTVENEGAWMKCEAGDTVLKDRTLEAATLGKSTAIEAARSQYGVSAGR